MSCLRKSGKGIECWSLDFSGQPHYMASKRLCDIVSNAWLEMFVELLVTNYNKTCFHSFICIGWVKLSFSFFGLPSESSGVWVHQTVHLIFLVLLTQVFLSKSQATVSLNNWLHKSTFWVLQISIKSFMTHEDLLRKVITLCSIFY